LEKEGFIVKMDRNMMAGYAVVIIGVVITMYTLAATATGFPLAEKTSGALLSFGGFITALGFITAGFWSTENEVLRTGLMVIGGATIIAMMVIL